MRLPTNSRNLETMQPPAEGYTPLFLSRVIGTSQLNVHSPNIKISQPVQDNKHSIRRTLGEVLSM
jgi:hypothetical protein